MNPATLNKAKELFVEIRKKARNHKGAVEIAIAAPFPFLSDLNRLSPSGAIAIAAQDVFFEVAGAYTGEVSLSMLKSVGVTTVIVGHSERRALGETNEDIYRDTCASLENKMNTIVCVGEKKRDQKGDYFKTVEFQLRAALAGVTKQQLKRLVVAYEPVWAIGTGDTATAEDAHEMKLFIKKVLTKLFTRAGAEKVRVLYGGSVKPKNAKELYEQGNVDGFLVGGASLQAKDFGEIIQATV